VNYETINLDRIPDDATAVLTLNRPATLNSLSLSLVDELRNAITEIAHDDGIRALIITGAGRGFCAGADLTDRRDMSVALGEGVYRSMERDFNPLSRELAALRKPVVAAVNGVAAGAGVGIALAADIVVAARSAYFAVLFGPRLGLVPDMGTTYYLVQHLGRARARALALLGDRLPAEQAEQWGLIWKCVDDDLLMDEARSLAVRLANGPQPCFGYIKRSLDAAERNTLAEQLNLERDYQRVLADAPDFIEGVTAFLQKRKPKFR